MSVFMIRFDDITPDMNWSKFNQGIELLKKYDIKPLLGIVPDNKDENLSIDNYCDEFFDIMVEYQKEGYIFAQHGYTHIYETVDSGVLGINNFSEFAGLSYEIQNNKIQNGKKILEEKGIKSNIFMAPGHSFDLNTIKALRENGFDYITDGMSDRVYIRNEMTFIPCTLRSWNKLSGVDTICIHTNVMNDNSFRNLERFINENRKDIVDYTVDFTAKRYSVLSKLEEKIMLKKRKFKDKLANSDTARIYFEKTNHSNKAIKVFKRIIYLPYLLFK